VVALQDAECFGVYWRGKQMKMRITQGNFSEKTKELLSMKLVTFGEFHVAHTVLRILKDNPIMPQIASKFTSYLLSKEQVEHHVNTVRFV
jgi:hypothetical protein